MPELFVGAKLIGSAKPLVDDKALRQRIARTNQKFAKRAKRSFEATTRTWRTVVVFHQETSTANLSVAVFTYNNIYGWINDGTSVRYAVMTPGFVAKTRPGVLGSRPGVGGFSHFSIDPETGILSPREGIEARQFDRLVEEKHGPDYLRATEDDLEWAVRSSS